MATVLTWNVAGRVKGVADQIEVVVSQPWDVVCLQEITPTTRDRWAAALEEHGMNVAASAWPVEPVGSRRLAAMIASRTPIEAEVTVDDLPWPERHLGVRTEVDGVAADVHTLHAPLSGKPDQVKVRTLEALFAALTRADDGRARVVTGDFNPPQYESREGEIHSFARTRAGNIKPDYGERHDAAELLLVQELPRRGWSDAFRALHGYARRDRSYMFANRKFGWRLDHILCSPPLAPAACEYVHEWREAGLSDHSAMWADLRARPA